MIELDGQPASGDLIKDTTDAAFMQDVIEASREVPVIVDFWAPWCGPCKQLTPTLEAAVQAAGGKVKMVKVNIDENQQIAGQLRVQSIPAVFGFVGGQPVDGFMGAVTGSEAQAFVKRLTEQGPGDGLAEALDAADQMLEQGALADATQIFGSVIQEDPHNARAFAGLVRVQLISGDLEKAKAILAQVPAEIAEDPAIGAIRSAIELQEQASGAGEAGELRAKLDADPDDHQSRFDLALALMGSGDNAGAVEELLELFRRDREWNESAAKEQLFKLFESLGPKDPLTLAGRRRLSSM
ncbi:MAG: co-chaperone YbbN, partial [Pseudomonadota bacterium]